MTVWNSSTGGWWRLQGWLTEDELSPHDVSFKLNEMPMSAIGYTNPRKAFKSLLVDQDEVS